MQVQNYVCNLIFFIDFKQILNPYIAKYVFHQALNVWWIMISYDIWGLLWDGPLMRCVMQNYAGRYKNLTLWHADKCFGKHQKYILNDVFKIHIYIQYSQYHSCWWPDDKRSQVICSYGNSQVCLVHSVSGMVHSFYKAWWRHQMETFSVLLALCGGNSPVTGEFTSQRPVTRSFDVFFDLRLNKQLRKQSWGWWFETPSRSYVKVKFWSTLAFMLSFMRNYT